MNTSSDSLGTNSEGRIKETPEERFRRVATRRTRLILRFLRLLGNTSGTGYRHTEADVEVIFSAIRQGLAQAEGKFSKMQEHEFSL
ncbi:MAG: hypothetical protein ACRD4X_13080 [Candidatus Acidiferrales bacterium]